MKILLLYISVLFFYSASGQEKIIKYYDADWSETTKDKAIYYGEFVKNGQLYKGTSYLMKTNQLQGVADYEDTTFANPVGLQLVYYEKGGMKDSIFTQNKKISFYYHFYPDGKLAGSFVQPAGSEKPVINGFDEDGRKIKNYIFMREAEFRGGQKGWISYITKKLQKGLLEAGDISARLTTYITFAIDEDGNVVNVKVKESSGNKKLDNIAKDIISESPEWVNAVLFNEPVKAYRIQPVTFEPQRQKTKK